MNILCIGDIIGKPGRSYIKNKLQQIIAEHNIDFVIANGENSAGGVGITKKVYDELIDYRIDAITLGNHSWDKKEIFTFIETADKLIRPANYPLGTPGKGFRIFEKNNKRIAVVNMCGRVYLDPIECPFRTMDNILKEIDQKADIIILDFHAEATSEKQALGWYLDGRVSAVFGTHTHVQTSDERILKAGTAYITDIGMTGPLDSILGVEREPVINKFLTSLPARFEVAGGDLIFGGIILCFDEQNKITDIKRLNLTEKV